MASFGIGDPELPLFGELLLLLAGGLLLAALVLLSELLLPELPAGGLLLPELLLLPEPVLTPELEEADGTQTGQTSEGRLSALLAGVVLLAVGLLLPELLLLPEPVLTPELEEADGTQPEQASWGRLIAPAVTISNCSSVSGWVAEAMPASNGKAAAASRKFFMYTSSIDGQLPSQAGFGRSSYGSRFRAICLCGCYVALHETWTSRPIIPVFGRYIGARRSASHGTRDCCHRPPRFLPQLQNQWMQSLAAAREVLMP